MSKNIEQLKQEIAELLAKRDLERQYLDADEHRRQLKKEQADEAERLCVEVQSKLDALQVELATCLNQLTDRQKELECTEKTLADTRELISDENQKLHYVKQSVQHHTQELAVLDEQTIEIETTHTKLQFEVNKFKQESIDLVSQIDSSTERLSQIRIELQELEGQLTNRTTQVEERLEELNQSISERENELTSINERIAEKESNRATSEKELETFVAKAEETKANIQNDIDIANQELADIQLKVEESILEYSSEITKLKNEKEDVERTLTNKKAELAKQELYATNS